MASSMIPLVMCVHSVLIGNINTHGQIIFSVTFESITWIKTKMTLSSEKYSHKDQKDLAEEEGVEEGPHDLPQSYPKPN